MANRYAAQQRDRSSIRAWSEAAAACTPMTSLVSGLALAAGGYLLDRPAVAACGAVASALGLCVERLRARTLRRWRRAERTRSQHEITELRRTIAQLREDVDAFQRALLDTEAALAAGSLPLLVRPAPRVPGPAPEVAAQRAAPHPADVQDRASATEDDQVVVIPLAQAETEDWVQTRGPAGNAPLPGQPPSPFVGAVTGSLPILPALAPATDAPVYAALTETDAGDLVAAGSALPARQRA